MGYGRFKQKFFSALRANQIANASASRPIMTFVGAVAELAKIRCVISEHHSQDFFFKQENVA